MKQFIKNPRVIIWLIFILISLFLLATNGLKYGVDFSGGTAFQIVLDEPVESSQLSRVTSVISRRLDWAGLKDAKVSASGNQYITAQIAESNPDEISKLKSNLLRQGKFECILNGEPIFVGEDIKMIYKDPQRGYGVVSIGDQGAKWTLPFLLSPKAAQNFAESTFHQCDAVGYGADTQYDCEKTYFFVDRPKDSIFVVDQELYLEEEKVPSTPGTDSKFVDFEEIINQVNTNYYIVDGNLTTKQLEEIKADLNTHKSAIVSNNISKDVINTLEDIGYKVKVENVPKDPDQYWIWQATGLKSIISLTEGVTNMNVPNIDSPRFEVFNSLIITGHSPSISEAQERLDNLNIILESGSLPIAIESISTESISPYLGDEFLHNSLLIAIVALILVALILFIRYRIINLSIPILLTGASEVFILLGILSLINYRLDLAAVAGILATIGTGVDHQIIITDQLLKGKSKDKQENVSTGSLGSKVKKAFFIVFAASSTTIATMLPIIFFSVGLSRLVGFAITIILGTLIGVFISRPVYAEFAKRVIGNLNKK